MSEPQAQLHHQQPHQQGCDVPVHGKLPISVVLAFRNEKAMLQECLPRLSFCSQLILIDMQSTDGSREVAQRFTHEIYDWPAEPIADPARAWAMQHVTEPWMLKVDPDEQFPEALVGEIAAALKQYPEAGGFRLPMRYYFKRKILTGTVWGSATMTTLALLHRERGRLLPWCNRVTEVLPGFATVSLPNTDENHIRHLWCDSYRDLAHKHLIRYPRKDAQRMLDEARPFRWRTLLGEAVGSFWNSYRHLDGWRLGLRGLLLSLIYGAYHFMMHWHLRRLTKQITSLGLNPPGVAISNKPSSAAPGLENHASAATPTFPWQRDAA
ncbi:MAG: glycosyltransferase [Phycisphaerales bacterium]|nr:glycosyltransferase [Phycisphaerales bacterium]